MEIFINNTTIEVVGNVETNEDRSRLFNTVRDLCEGSVISVRINFNKTSSMSSTLIGALVKLRIIDKIDLSIGVTDQRIFNLLKYMGMDDILKVSAIKTD